jgi:hypothetical protein
MDNVQKHNICINVPWSQTFRCFVPHFLEYGRWTKSKNPEILSIIHHRRKPWERKSSLNVSLHSLLQRFHIWYVVKKKKLCFTEHCKWERERRGATLTKPLNSTKRKEFLNLLRFCQLVTHSMELVSRFRSIQESGFGAPIKFQHSKRQFVVYRLLSRKKYAYNTYREGLSSEGSNKTERGGFLKTVKWNLGKLHCTFFLVTYTRH